MRSLDWLCAIFLLVLAAGWLTECCEYPDVVRGKEYLVNKNEQTVGAITVDATQTVTFGYNTSTYKTYTAYFPPVPFSVHCDDGLLVGSTFYYRRHTGDDDGNMACAQFTVTSTGGAILYKDIETQVAWDAEGCREKLEEDANEPASWYPQYSMPATGPDCPFAEGMYQLTYDLGSGSQCVGNQSSTAMVNGSTLSLSSCSAAPSTYENPVNLELTCMESVSEMDTMGSESGNGDFLLLADLANPADPAYYCARYLEKMGAIEISLDTTDHMETRCRATHTSHTAGEIIADDFNLTFVALVLLGEVGTTEETGMTESSSVSTTELKTDGPDDDDDDDDDEEEMIILVVLLVVLALIVFGIVAVAVAICHYRRRAEEQESKDYQSMHSEHSEGGDLSNNKAWYASYNVAGNAGSNNAAFSF